MAAEAVVVVDWARCRVDDDGDDDEVAVVVVDDGRVGGELACLVAEASCC